MIDAVDILDAVAQRFGLQTKQLLRQRRRKWLSSEVHEARTVACWLLRVLLDLSYPAVARAVGLRSHADIIRALQRFGERPDLYAAAADLSIELSLRGSLPVSLRHAADQQHISGPTRSTFTVTAAH